MKKVNKSKEYCLLVYVESCSPKIKRFSTKAEMGKFVDRFQKQYPDHMELYSDNWVDYCITGVTGEVSFFTDGMEVE